MRLGLVSYKCENKNIQFNIKQIETAMKSSEGKVDLLCFGEAFLQGFDSLCWNYEIDKDMAVDLSSDTISLLKTWTIEYNMALALGYIEKDKEKLYSSYVVISGGKIIHNFRRISKGWKEYDKTDVHYCEGTDTESFNLFGKDFNIALCGDLWDYPERFQTDNLLLWPVYVNYEIEEWNDGVLDEYASQAGLVSDNVLMINPLDDNPVNHGGSFYFQNGRIISRTEFDKQDILIVDIQ